VLGIDLSKEYVEFAKRRNPFPDRVGFQLGGVPQLRFSGATFQTSLSLLVLNFVSDSKKALREVRRVTKAGAASRRPFGTTALACGCSGYFILGCCREEPTAEMFDELHMPLCRAGELRELWLRTGLEHVAERPLDITMRFESFPDYWDPFLLR
jgi:SAM-dependent methyltransferase